MQLSIAICCHQNQWPPTSRRPATAVDTRPLHRPRPCSAYYARSISECSCHCDCHSLFCLMDTALCCMLNSLANSNMSFNYHYYRLFAILHMNLSQPVHSWVLFLHLFQNGTFENQLNGFLWADCFSCFQVISVKQ